MIQSKQNIPSGATSKLQKGIHPTNDYVFKRFKLQQNKNFTNTPLQADLQYQINAEPSQSENNAHQTEDIVIINNEIINFDEEDEQQDQESQQDKEVNVTDKWIDHHQKEGSVDDVVLMDPSEDDHPPAPQIDHNFLEVQPQIVYKPRKNTNYSLNSTRNQESHNQLLQPSISSILQSQKSQSYLPNILDQTNDFPDDQEEEYQKKYQQDDQQIKGTNISDVGTLEDDVVIQVLDKKLFVESVLPAGIILKCVIKRSPGILKNLISSEFDMYLFNGLAHILSAKQTQFRNRNLFSFSTTASQFTNSSTISTLNTNISHNLYWLLSNTLDQKQYSSLQLLVNYQKIDKMHQHRKMEAMMPIQSRIRVDPYAPNLDTDYLSKRIEFKVNNAQKWDVFENQDVKVDNSDKNFAMCDEEDQNFYYLRMQKESQNIFTLYIQHPLSPLQAMAVAMTRFDAQLK